MGEGVGFTDLALVESHLTMLDSIENNEKVSFLNISEDCTGWR